jgi:hypothetical protein
MWRAHYINEYIPPHKEKEILKLLSSSPKGVATIKIPLTPISHDLDNNVCLVLYKV